MLIGGSSPFILIFYFFNRNFISVSLIFVEVLFFLSLYLNHIGYHTISKLFVILIANLATFLYSSLFGESSGTHLLYFSFTGIPMVLFDNNRPKIIRVFTLFPVVCFFVLYLFRFSIFPSIQLTKSESSIVFYAVTTIAFCIIVLYLKFFISQSNVEKQKIVAKNNALQKANLEIEKKAKIEADMELGKELQKKYLTTLPPHLPTHSNIQFATYYSSAKTLGGDYYYADWTDDILRYALVDVTGKGLTAALMTISIHALIQRLYKKTPPVRLEQMMAHLNNDYISLPVVKTACDTFLMSLDLRDCLIKIDT